MKTPKALFLLLILVAAVVGFTGCASLNAPNTESLLSAAGFQTKSPETDKQIEFYGNLPAFELQRTIVKGRVVYVYADKKHTVLYFGGEKAYQRYKQLSLKQQIAEDKLSAAEMDEDAAMDWNGWGPWGGTFWD